MNRKIHTVISEHLYRRFRNVRTVQPEFACDAKESSKNNGFGAFCLHLDGGCGTIYLVAIPTKY